MNTLESPPWIADLKAALDAEYGDRPRIATLASVDAGRRPRARTVVLRRIDDDGALWITSSAHAGKNAQLRDWPFAELVFYFPTSRRQFRLAGMARVIGCMDDQQSRRQRFWAGMSDAARAAFFWPQAGLPANSDSQVIAAMPAQTPMPDEFELIHIDPDEAEELDINVIPHLRIRRVKANQWNPQRINP